MKLVAKAVAALTLRGMMYCGFLNLKKLLSPEVYNSLHRSVFSSIAKFVLTVFDPEDFERIFNLELLDQIYKKLFGKLHQLESEGVHALIGIAEETISVKEFPILREHGCWRDIGASHHSVRDRTVTPTSIFGFGDGTLKFILPCGVMLALEEMEKCATEGRL